MGENKDLMLKSINTMLHPDSIAIVGASAKLQYGGRFLNNLLQTNYKGKIYPINPRYEELMGVRCYPSISSLPEAPDLVAIIIPFENVLSVLDECGQKGAKTGVIITGGFAELGSEDRKAAQKALSDFAQRSGMRLTGPNCLGIANVKDGIWPCSALLTDIKAASVGDLALVSQSGATAFGPALAKALDRGLGFSYIISTGNEADLDTTDFMSYCIHRPEVKSIVAYFESIRDVAKFRSVAEEALRLGKPIVALKIGRSLAGQKAALSHTASMTGSDEGYDALFKQVGVIRVEDWDELLEIGSFLVKTPPFTKEAVGIVAHSGGVASILADKCDQVMAVPQPSNKTRQGLENILKGFGSSANPADITWHAFEEEFTDILNFMLGDDAFGGVVLGTAGADSQAQRIINAAAKSRKPLAMLWTKSEREVDGLKLLQSSQVPVFFRVENLAKALKASLFYHKARAKLGQRVSSEIVARPLPKVDVRGKAGPLGLLEGFELLSSYGINTLQAKLAHNPKEAKAIADSIGYPVVLKVDSPTIRHQTDLGLVKVGLKSKAELEKAFREIKAKLKSLESAKDVRGILVRKMAKDGLEVIIGVKRDPQLGHLLLFGLGGIFTEVLKDFSLRVCPVTFTDIQEMVREIKGFKLLEGSRGHPPADVDALEQALFSTSQLATSLGDKLAEVDINPLIVSDKGQGVVAVDNLIVFNG